jgi:D-alanyl-D-alanine carboxypeptidase/D-alanyl-D-alanine-endopeptidase (penicillin-binding protein 4)
MKQTALFLRCLVGSIVVLTLSCAPASRGPVEPPGPQVFVPSPAAAPVDRLRAEFDQILADPAFANAHWGVMVQSVETGEVLYRLNARKLFLPASNVKLVTSSVALTRLGADFRFRTRVVACGPIDATGGVLNGDLLIIGGGDPAISSRFSDDDPAGVFRSWADTLKARGITHIRGNVVGDDDLFDDTHIGPGWSWDNLGYAYSAEIGSLLLNEGVVRLRVTPGESAGERVNVEIEPATDYLTLENLAITTADSTGVAVSAARRPFSTDAVLGGRIWIGTNSITRYVPSYDPTMFFVTVLKETLEAEGIDIGGEPVDRDDVETECRSDTPLFVHESPTLEEILVPFMKESQNQIGEMLMRYVGAAATDTGSVRTGRRVAENTLMGWGIPDDSYVYYDGSGLSRYNYLAPEAIVRLLRAMALGPDFEALYNALPIAGVDGTLRRRMRGTGAEGNVRAKTGSVSNARTLSGYVTTKDDELLAFSILTNNFDTPNRPVEYVQDLLVERLVHFERE